jgi:hypothetical protein
MFSRSHSRRETVAVARVAPMKGGEGAPGRYADDDRLVNSLDGMQLKLAFQAFSSRGGARYDEHPARSLVEAVDNPGANASTRLRVGEEILSTKESERQ